MLRKVMLVGFITLFERGSPSQLICGVLWTLGFMVHMARIKPYRLDFADSFKLAVDTALVVTLICTMYLKLDLFPELIGTTTAGWIIIVANLLLPGLVAADYYRASHGPSSPFRASVCAAHTLNATGQSRITLSPRYANLRADCEPRQKERVLKSVPK